jgi:LysR family hydrogen peroxide-inducible transcriptional activator
MTKSQIEYILALDNLRNFGLAADACYVSQSTLSAMVAKFEENIGLEIFNRKMRPVTVTTQGQKVIKSLRSIYREYQLLDEKINEIKGFEVGALSIACIPTVAPYLYPLILNPLSLKYPKVNFTIHELTTEVIEDEIINGNIDVGIISPPLDNKELIEYPLYEEQFFIYDCGDSAKKKKYKIKDIDIDRLWLLEEGHCMRNQISQICDLRQSNKMNGNIIYSCGSIYTLTEMVQKNKGITLIPCLALIENSQIDQSRIFKIDPPPPFRRIGLVTHKNFIKTRMLDSISKIIIPIVEKHKQDHGY